MNSIVRGSIFLCCLAVLNGGCVSQGDVANGDVQESGWRLVYSNDENGNTLEGSKADLISAIRSGKPVRVYTAGRRIEHASDALFLSVFDEEVFAQTIAIESQRPATDPIRIEFREPGVKWRSIVGTNGFVTAFMDGKEPNIRRGATRWFVQ